jgi:predicted nucleotidyltransferase
MATLVTSDRSLNSQAEKVINRQAYENSVGGQRRKRRRRNWTEFLRTAKGGVDLKLSAEVKEWFINLEPQTRLECLSYEHGWLCLVLQRMFHRKLKDGEGNFILQEDRLAAGELDPQLDYFHFQRKEHEVFSVGAKHNLENELEGFIRLTDGETYLDTLSVSPAATKDPQRLLQLMSELTQGHAFEVPCKLIWDPYFKLWMLESPVWFSATTYNSFAKWICCGLEKAIWHKFWERAAADPRRESHSDSSLKYLTDTPSLIEYWSSLSRSRRNDLVGDYRELSKELRVMKLEEFISEKPASAVYVSDLYYSNFSPGLITSCLLPQKFAELRRKLSFFNSEDSVRDLTQAVSESSPAEFFEFLLMSSSERAGTRLDQLCRKVAHKIKAALSQKEADDLLISEISDRPPKNTVPKRKKKKRQSKRRLSEDSSSTSASGRLGPVTPEDEVHDNFGKKIVAGMLLDIIADIEEEPCVPQQTEPLAEDDDSFLTVTHSKRKPSTKVQRKKDKTKLKKQRHQPRKINSSLLSSPLLKSSAVAFVQWESPDSSAKLLNSEEFPPLAPSPQVKPNYAKLTSELEKLQSKIENEIEDLKPARISLMDKVSDIVRSLFPRSFIQLYGSNATGLALPSSDIDIVVVNSGVYSSEHLVASLKFLGNVLSNCSWVSQIIVLDKAAVPVVKLTADGTYFGCDQPIEADISIDEYGLERPSNSGMTTTLLTQAILTETPQVATLCLFLKQLLHKHKLNSAFKGKA